MGKKKKILLPVRGQGKGLSFLCFYFLLAIYHCVIFCTSYKAVFKQFPLNYKG